MRLEVRAPAKVNLGLRVLGRRRADGYHRIRTLLVGIDLWDALRFEPVTGERTRLDCDVPGIPTDDRNLVLKAARLLAEAAPSGRKQPVRIRLSKRIPPGKGLGGGSADAAAALLALNRIWGLGLRRRELAALAVRVGMDTPWFLTGGLALAAGRGEALYPLAAPDPGLALVLALPDFQVSTREAYGKVRAAATIRDSSRAAVDLPGVGPTPLVNDMESSEALPPYAVPQIRNALDRAGALASSMSGSGSAVFGVFPGWEEACRGAEALRADGMDARPVRTVSRETHRAALQGIPLR